MMDSSKTKYKRTLDARVVKQEARGQWFYIYTCLLPGIDNAIARAGKHVACPFHGGTDGFRFYKDANETGGCVCNTCGNFDDGLALLKWFYRGDFAKAVDDVGDVLGLKDEKARKIRAVPDPVPAVETEEARKKREYKDRKCREELTRVWTESVPLADVEAEPVRLYLARRGLSLQYALSSEALRYHPGLPYFEEGVLQGKFPSMLAMVFDSAGKPVTIHRTFLTAEGYKAPVKKPKKLMPYPSDRKLTGGSIPIINTRSIIGNLQGRTAIGVTEGIETALAIIEASNGNLPVWALISDRVLENFSPPDWVDVVYIYGDQDRETELKLNAGKVAAQNLRAKLAKNGREARGWLPSPDKIPEGADSVDWLDVFLKEGPDAIPIPEGLQQHPMENTRYA